MEVIVTKAQLEEKGACGDQYESPYWNNSRQALVYPDWAAAVERFLTSRDGVRRLRFLVFNGLVPMTRDELAKSRWATRPQRLADERKAKSNHGA